MTTQKASRPLGAGGCRVGEGIGETYKRNCTTPSSKGQVPVYNSAGQVVGHLTPDGWLEKRNLDPAKHMLRKPAGWATDADHLSIPGLKGIRIVTVDGKTWEADIAAWRRYGIPINRGFGAQVCLPLAYWRHSKGEACQLPLLGGEATP